MVNVVVVHTGGVLDVPGATMFEKMTYLQTQADDLRRFLLNQPRGRVTQCVDLVLPSSNPAADVGFVIMESGGFCEVARHGRGGGTLGSRPH